MLDVLSPAYGVIIEILQVGDVVQSTLGKLTVLPMPSTFTKYVSGAQDPHGEVPWRALTPPIQISRWPHALNAPS